VDFHPNVEGDMRDVPCRLCPKFRSFPPHCIVPIGSRLRACVCASIEYNFHDVRGERVLEVGCGENPFTRTVVEHAGGEWIGLDPRAGKEGRKSVRNVGGEAQHLPFADGSFDIVMGVQTIEHWDRSQGANSKQEYMEGLSEVWRAVRPGGSIYFDAPIHLHGSPDFIRGNFEGIRRIFSYHPWENVQLVTWRKNHSPLRKKIASKIDRSKWPDIFHHDKAILSELKGKSSYVVAITAQKPGDAKAPTLAKSADLLQGLLPILACPLSRKSLHLVGDRLISTDATTRRAYKIENGVPILLINESVELSEQEWHRLLGQ
jgi:ubiquinone/menaquinone biosynthesis C-methylase UbiE/uncharacterized protein YbaR (Trm112 family)